MTAGIVSDYFLTGDIQTPVSVQAHVIIFDDKSVFTFPKNSTFPVIQAGVCICWDLFNQRKCENIIQRMGYFLNYVVPCTQKRSFRPAHGQTNAPKTTFVALLLFSSSNGQKLTWFSKMNDDISFPFLVCIFLCFFFFKISNIFFRFLQFLLLRNQKC